MTTPEDKITEALLALITGDPRNAPPIFVLAHTDAQVNDLRSMLSALHRITKYDQVRRLRGEDDTHLFYGYHITPPLFLLDGWDIDPWRFRGNVHVLLRTHEMRAGKQYFVSDAAFTRLRDTISVLHKSKP